MQDGAWSKRRKRTNNKSMGETKFEVGQKVTILDVHKVGEVTAVSEDGQVTVKYTDDAGAEQTDTYGAERLGRADSEQSVENDEG